MRPVLIDDDRRRRLLVERQLVGAAGRSGRSVVDVANSLALIHSTDPSSTYLSVQARSDASIGDVDCALYVDRTLLRHTTLRRTLFAMPLAVVPLAHGAVNGGLVDRLRTNLLGWIEASPDRTVPAEQHLADVERAVIERLDAGAVSGAALAAAVPGLQLRIDPVPRAASSSPIRITSRVLELMAAEGRIARGRPTGTSFTSGSWTWESIERWLGTAGIEPVPAEDALVGLLARYLTAFAPATVTDLTWWTGLTKTRVRAALTSLRAIEVELEGVSEPGFVAADDDLSVGQPDGSVALLPGLDSTAMGWKQRSWYVDDRPSTGLFDRSGNAGPTVWLDGRVVGTWTQRASGDIVTLLTGDLGAVERSALDLEVDRLTTWLGATRVNWRFPTPLTKQLASA